MERPKPNEGYALENDVSKNSISKDSKKVNIKKSLKAEDDAPYGDHKKRQKETITFAAPVILNELRGNMAVVVNFNGNKYNAHRIILPDGTVYKFSEINKEVKQESYQGVTENSSLADTTSFTSKNSISKDSKKVKHKKTPQSGR